MRKALALLVASQKTEKNSLQKVSELLHWEVSQMSFEKETLFLIERLRPNIIFFDLETYEWEEFEFIDRVKQISPETFLVLLLRLFYDSSSADSSSFSSSSASCSFSYCFYYTS